MQPIGISNDVRPYSNRIFNISMTAVSAQGFYKEENHQKGVLITNSLFKLTRDNKNAAIRGHKRGYHATVRLLGFPHIIWAIFIARYLPDNWPGVATNGL